MIRSRMVTTRDTPLAARGLVTAEHPLGAEVGAGILARGGNAVDAAVATAFAMTVVEPFMSTIGGGGTMLIHLARRGETVALDFNVEAPAACHERSYELGEGVATDIFPWRRVVDDANVFGPRSVAVPGSVAGLCMALERWGTMALEDVLAPAIALAEDGFEVDWYVALTIGLYCQELAAFPETARTYLREGRYPYRSASQDAGDRLRQPDLARSLRLIAREGPAAFYRGAIAQAISEEIASRGGFLTAADLSQYEPRVQAPLLAKYRGLDLAFSPGATGGITTLEMLNVLSAFPRDRVGHDTATGLHLRAEALRLAFLDRFRHLGDPARVKAPWHALAGRPYAGALAALLRPSGPRVDARAIDPWPHELDGAFAGRRSGRARTSPSGGRAAVAGSAGRRASSRRAASDRAATGSPHGSADCTTHVCAVDRQRNLVSLTNTAVSLFGSRMVVPETGILLANGMVWFDPEPGRANSVEGGKRPLVNMVPVLGFRGGEPHLALGAPGGRKIVSAIGQVISNMVDLGETPQQAIESPRLHTEGDALWVEDRVGDRSLAALRRMGHDVVPRRSTHGTFYFARPVAIRVTKRGLEAGLDHLNDAAAAGA